MLIPASVLVVWAKPAVSATRRGVRRRDALPMRCVALRFDAVRRDALPMRCVALRFDAVRCDALRCNVMCCGKVRCGAMRCEAMLLSVRMPLLMLCRCWC